MVCAEVPVVGCPPTITVFFFPPIKGCGEPSPFDLELMNKQQQQQQQEE